LSEESCAVVALSRLMWSIADSTEEPGNANYANSR
jgi:hypothetical protein